VRVLVACEYSGRVRDAFIRRGHNAVSCDILPSDAPGPHLQGDVRRLLGHQWDLVIAFPPCTHLSLAGAVHWKAKQADGRQRAAAEFFMAMINAPAAHVAVENPRGIMTKLYRPPDQVVEPWWFGDPYAKKTCLWLKGLPPLEADSIVTPVGRVATGGGSWRTDTAAGRTAMSAYEDSEGRKNRAKVRSRTFPGIARAMADQWGNVL
jgi:hypothetical protein